MQGLFLQSHRWAEFQRSVDREVFRVETDYFSAYANTIKLPGGKNYLYIPYGPVADLNPIKGSIKQEVQNFISKLGELAREKDSIFIKIEPQYDSIAELFAEQGFKKPKKETTPHRTVVIDIGGREDDILASMHHKTRYNIRVAQKHGVSVSETGDVGAFAGLVRKTCERNTKRYPLYSEGYYRKFLDFFSGGEGLRAKLFLAFKDSEPVAGAIVLIDGKTGYYMYGGSDREHSSSMAPYLLHWEIILYLKLHGVELYDMWMIDPKHWRGVTRFKLGWAGRQVEYPGSFDLPIQKNWYRAYSLYRKIFK